MVEVTRRDRLAALRFLGEADERGLVPSSVESVHRLRVSWLETGSRGGSKVVISDRHVELAEAFAEHGEWLKNALMTAVDASGVTRITRAVVKAAIAEAWQRLKRDRGLEREALLGNTSLCWCGTMVAAHPGGVECERAPKVAR